MSNSTSLKFNKAIPRLITLIILSIVMLFSTLSDNITAYAAGASMVGSGISKSNYIGQYGINENNDAYLFWVQDIDDTTGATSSAVWFYNCKGNTDNTGYIECAGYQIPITNIRNRFNKPISASINKGQSTKFDELLIKPLTGHGGILKENLLNLGPNGKAEAYNLIKFVYGQTAADRWERGETVLAFEPVYWGWLLITKPNGTYDVYSPFIGTSVQWAEEYMKPSYGARRFDNGETSGCGWINRFTNYNYPGAVMFEEGRDYMGIHYYGTNTAHAYSDYRVWYDSEIANRQNGLGIGVVFNGEGGGIDTYDGSNSPGPTEPATPGTSSYREHGATIIKHYWSGIINPATGKPDYTNTGNYITFEGLFFFA